MVQITNNNVISTPLLPMPKFKGLGSALFQHMLEHKTKTAHTDIDTGRSETYESILQKTIRTSLAMRSKGIKPDDIITICSNTTIDSFIAFYASFFVGAVAANLDPKLPLADVVYMIKLVSPKMIFVIPDSVKLIEDALQEAKLDSQIVVFGETSEYLPYSQFLLPSPEEDTFIPYEVSDLKDTAIISFSSGSTGLPKGICINHYALSALTYQMAYMPFLHAPVMLTFANLFWISSTAHILAAIKFGTNRLTTNKFDSREIWNVLKTYKVEGVFLNSYQILEMCKNGRPDDADTSSLRYVGFAGSPTTAEQNAHIRKCFPGTFVPSGYGQTEAGGAVLTFDPTDEKSLAFMNKYPDSVGRPLPGISYKIVNISTQEIVGANKEGELRIKSEYLMNGYYNADCSETWDDDGYFKTGDLAYYNEDRCFFITGRIKELLKYQMWHVFPTQIENILHNHPAVQNCVVIGIPDKVDGDHPMGVVRLKESAVGTVTEDELQKYVDDQVVNYQKLRGGVRFVNEFPLTVTGKISKIDTRKYVLEGRI